MKEAQLYTRLENRQVHCQLCAHNCKIPEGKFGFCRVRQNISGTLYTHNYGKLVAANIDPVEKKPLYHFLPGSSTFSIASSGCNFRCGFCQNWEISQFNLDNPHLGENFSAGQVITLAQESGCRSIAYTYTEPTIYFEFALETAKLARAAGLRNIFVTNGYLTRQAISLLCPYMDAANIDLKFFKENSYLKICSAKLSPVLDSIQSLHAAGVWIEITTLIIPGENDNPEELAAMAKFIAAIDKDIPWHISRFHPDYNFKDYAPTSELTLKLAYNAGVEQGLRYVYAGNFTAWGQDTLCGKCHKLLIKRDGFNVLESHLSQNRCVFCQAVLPGVFGQGCMHAKD
ncbi:MAG: AmmeMemoRadiSam system radical SAM enzyme [Candidatus Omnitrophica bacterium]|nr:AmmeMemoRadiSam system radical SAM enzyme [Candidatus Omnitrophota bacterium]